MSRAVELDPQLASARTNLGQFLLELGRPDEALPHCQAAVALQPEMAGGPQQPGKCLSRAGPFRRGPVVLRRGGPARTPRCLRPASASALTLQLEGRWDEALPWLRRATELQPDSLEYLVLLAEAAVDREHFAEAIDCYQKIIERRPRRRDRPQRAGLALAGGRPARASRPSTSRRRCACGRTWRSRTSPSAVCTKRRATSPPPKPASGRRLEDDEAGSHALARLAMLLRGKLPDDDCEAIEATARRSRPGRPGPGQPFLRPGKRLGCARALCRSRRLCARGQCPRARRVRAAKPGARSGRARAVRLGADRGVRAGAVSSAWPDAGLDTRRPVFIVGLPRSGNHSDRADPGQPFSVPRGRRATAGPTGLSGDPRACSIAT